MEIRKLDHPDQYGSLYKAFGMVPQLKSPKKSGRLLWKIKNMVYGDNTAILMRPQLRKMLWTTFSWFQKETTKED